MFRGNAKKIDNDLPQSILQSRNTMTRAFFLSTALILGCLSSLGADTDLSLTQPALKSPFNVRDFGAKGDGQTNDTAAFQKALDLCADAGGGTVIVPAGIYLTGSITLSSNTILRLESRANLVGSPDIADYPLVRVRWEGEFTQGHRALISAEKADHIAIVSSGSITGPPLRLSQLRNPRGPALIEIAEATNVVLEGFAAQYQRLWSIHLLFCQNLTARNLTIRSINANGDGIDVDSCQDVLIEHCDINTGDDAISLKSGRGLEAVRIGRPTQNVVIKNCTLASSQFAALGIGSEMSGGIRNVRLENCAISGHQNGIFIKSRDGRGGFIEDITGENLTINNSPTFIAIDLLKKGIQATKPVTGGVEKWARLQNITFKNIKVNNVAELVAAANIPPEKPMDGLTLANITGTCRRALTLANIVNANLSGINVIGFQGPLLTMQNVKGTGLDNSAAVQDKQPAK
jgi:polygalacturonase